MQNKKQKTQEIKLDTNGKAIPAIEENHKGVATSARKNNSPTNEDEEFSEEEIAREMEARFGFKPYNHDGRMIKALLHSIDGIEPRALFIELQHTLGSIIKVLKTDKGKELFKGLKGFNNLGESKERLRRLYWLMGDFTNWNVDAYLQYCRLLDPEFTFTPIEKFTLNHLYVEENGFNENMHDVKLQERVLTAETYRKWEEEANKSPEQKELEERIAELYETKKQLTEDNKRSKAILKTFRKN